MRTRVNLAAAVLVALLATSAPMAAQSVGTQSGQATPEELSLRPGDALRINIWPDNTLSGQFEVEETGLVYLPFLGALPVVGVSLDRLRAELREGYSQILKEPVVTITPLFSVGVSGGVGRPGNYQITPTENIMDVILMAGGFTQRAKEDQVEIVRQGQVLKYNVERALEEAADLDALTLRSGDQIVVPLGGTFSFRDFTAIFSFVTTTALLIVSLVDNSSSN